MKQALQLVLIINVLILTANAANAVDNSVDDLEEDWHKGNMCISCHNSILPESSSKIINDECKCHYPPEDPVWYDKVDIQSIKNIHGNRPCIKCHINSIAITNKENLHGVHIATECEKCHGSQNITRPSFLDCFSCHEQEIHGVHEDLEDLCIICHGKFGGDSVQKFASSGVPVSADISAIPEKRPFPTVIEFLTSFSQWLPF